MKRVLYVISALTAFLVSFNASAQIKPIPFGNMEHWMVRQVDESGIIGGKTKFLYEVASGDTLKNNTPYVPNLKVSPWATSSVLAVVKGVTKSSCTVFPEYHGKGRAARLETRIERVKVLGLINISVLATGTIFLGEIAEPVRDTKNPQAKLMMGIPFTERPKSIIYDYKFEQGAESGKRMKMTGFSRVQDIPGVNCAEMCLLLQKRWEDADGKVYAKRVGTAWVRYDKDTKSWVNANEVPIM
uniref:PCMD domain-containing protein n=1 Tax=Candidatus Cryptobacteroides bacterium TaxID=3085639 RepID=UPI00402A3DC2